MKIFLLGLIGLVIGTFVILFGGGGAAIYLAILTGLFGLNAAKASSTSLVTALPSLRKKRKPQKQLRKRSLPEWKLEFMVFWVA